MARRPATLLGAVALLLCVLGFSEGLSVPGVCRASWGPCRPKATRSSPLDSLLQVRGGMQVSHVTLYAGCVKGDRVMGNWVQRKALSPGRGEGQGGSFPRDSHGLFIR